MRANELREAFSKIHTSDKIDEKIKQNIEYRINSAKRKTGGRRKRFAVVMAALLVLLLVGNVTGYAFSEGYRNSLSDFLHIEGEDTHYIGNSDSDNGINMSVESTHVVGNTAMVMAVFTKENGESFKNGMNPDVELKMDSKELSGFLVYSNLSGDGKELCCYISFQIEQDYIGKKVALTVNGLECNESQVTDLDFEEEFEDAHISGRWESEFVLEPDSDNTQLFVNSDNGRTVSMCGRTLEIERAVVGDMIVIVDTVTIGEIEPLPSDPLSNIYVGSGAYYDVFVTIYYKNGSVDKLDCALDGGGNIIAYALNVINKYDIEKITVGNCTLEKSKFN